MTVTSLAEVWIEIPIVSPLRQISYRRLPRGGVNRNIDLTEDEKFAIRVASLVEVWIEI